MKQIYEPDTTPLMRELLSKTEESVSVNKAIEQYGFNSIEVMEELRNASLSWKQKINSDKALLYLDGAYLVCRDIGKGRSDDDHEKILKEIASLLVINGSPIKATDILIFLNEECIYKDGDLKREPFHIDNAYDEDRIARLISEQYVSKSNIYSDKFVKWSEEDIRYKINKAIFYYKEALSVYEYNDIINKGMPNQEDRCRAVRINCLIDFAEFLIKIKRFDEMVDVYKKSVYIRKYVKEGRIKPSPHYEFCQLENFEGRYYDALNLITKLKVNKYRKVKMF